MKQIIRLFSGIGLLASVAVIGFSGFPIHRVQAQQNSKDLQSLCTVGSPAKDCFIRPFVVDQIVLEGTKADWLKYGADVQKTFLAFLKNNFEKAVQLYPEYVKYAKDHVPFPSSLLCDFNDAKEYSYSSPSKNTSQQSLTTCLFQLSFDKELANLIRELSKKYSKGIPEYVLEEVLPVSIIKKELALFDFTWFLQHALSQKGVKDSTVLGLGLGGYSPGSLLNSQQAAFDQVVYRIRKNIISAFATEKAGSAHLVSAKQYCTSHAHFFGGLQHCLGLKSLKGGVLYIDHIYSFKTDYSWVGIDPIKFIDQQIDYVAQTLGQFGFFRWLLKLPY